MKTKYSGAVLFTVLTFFGIGTTQGSTDVDSNTGPVSVTKIVEKSVDIHEGEISEVEGKLDFRKIDLISNRIHSKN